MERTESLNRVCVAKKRIIVCVDLKVAFKEMLHQGTELKKVNFSLALHTLGKHLDRQANYSTRVCAYSHACVCVSVKFFNLMDYCIFWKLAT